MMKLSFRHLIVLFVLFDPKFTNVVWICQILQEISQKRTREWMSDQEAKEIEAKAREIMPQPSAKSTAASTGSYGGLSHKPTTAYCFLFMLESQVYKTCNQKTKSKVKGKGKGKVEYLALEVGIVIPHQTNMVNDNLDMIAMVFDVIAMISEVNLGERDAILQMTSGKELNLTNVFMQYIILGSHQDTVPVALAIFAYECVKLYKESKKRKSTGNPKSVCEAAIDWTAATLCVVHFVEYW
ncbi:hypothetical protein Tco_0819417 [Tanacetum coccineum]|uniref:Uncharacterized protein n=1 Tax=Tanacetum coccineum TaxID=301880 RepID=A0ABQ5AAR8_9ASTR